MRGSNLFMFLYLYTYIQLSKGAMDDREHCLLYLHLYISQYFCMSVSIATKHLALYSEIWQKYIIQGRGERKIYIRLMVAYIRLF